MSGDHASAMASPIPAPPRPRRRAARLAWLTLLLAAAPVTTLASASDQPLEIGNQPPSPATPATPATLTARRATTWQDEAGAQWLLLEHDVHVDLTTHAFRAERALVRVQSLPAPPDDADQPSDMTHRALALYLDTPQPVGEAPVRATGPRMLVTAATTGPIELQTDAHHPAAAPILAGAADDTFLAVAQRRVAAYDRGRSARQAAPGHADAPVLLAQAPAGRDALDARHDRGGLDDLAEPTPADLADPATPATPAERGASGGVLPTTGSLAFHARRVVADRTPEEQVVMLIGDVRLLYESGPGRSVTLQAERAVLYLDRDDAAPATTPAEPPADARGPLDGVSAAGVRGVYLEDNVIVSDGQFTVRAPRMYYDLVSDRAVLLEAVVYTFDPERQIPLYLRAAMVRQISRGSFEARDAIMTTSAFAEPHFAIGAQRVTMRQVEDPDGGMHQRFTATHSTLRVFDTPVLYWPWLAAQTREGPLRAWGASYSDRRGLEVQTAWDLFALAGRQTPEGVDLQGRLDYRGRHGPAVGVELDYDLDATFGRLEGYLLPYDRGTDYLSLRRDIDHDGETRGYARFQHRQPIQDAWQLSLEGAYVSDETFLEEFARDQAFDARPYETALHLLRRDHQWSADLLLTGQLTDFQPQLTSYQAPGYEVERLPEVGIFQTGTSLLGDRLTWFSETQLSRLRAVFGRDTPADRGLRQNAALATLGIDADTAFHAAAADAGFPQDWRTRFDTRHEIAAPLAVGPLNVTPYAVGRFTAYDERFSDFHPDEEQFRAWAGAGTRLSTALHRSYDGIDSQMLDLHRLRHTIEPRVDVFYADASISPSALPTYDPQVEGLDEGLTLRAGFLNTLQTQRGGPGRWRSVDWLSLETDIILRGGERDGDARLPRFVEHRPEFSQGGTHFASRARWRVSEAVGFVGEATYSFEHDQVTDWVLGASLRHTPRLTSFVNYRDIRALDSRLLTYGGAYQLTSKYRISATHRWDLSADESRSISIELERRLPQWRVRLTASIDELEDEQVIGIVFIPEGFGDLAAGPIPLAEFGD
ncbi:MAG: LPS assembly protein LptD [Phycisphaeraceae bacterium]